MKQKDLPERRAAEGQRKRRERQRNGGRIIDPLTQAERPSERGGPGCAAWLYSPLGGVRSPCGEPAAEPELEESGDTETSRHEEPSTYNNQTGAEIKNNNF